MPAFAGMTIEGCRSNGEETYSRLRRLDIRPLDAIEILPFDADQLHRCIPLRRVDVADIVETGVAGLHDIGLHGLDKRRRAGVALLQDSPVRHFRDAGGLSINGPARAMIMGRTVRRAIIDVTADAEPQLRVLVDDLARVGTGSAVLQMGLDEGFVSQRPRHVPTHLLLARGTGIVLERRA